MPDTLQSKLADLGTKVAAEDKKLDSLRADADLIAAQLAEAKTKIIDQSRIRDALRTAQMRLQDQIFAEAGGEALRMGDG